MLYIKCRRRRRRKEGGGPPVASALLKVDTGRGFFYRAGGVLRFPGKKQTCWPYRLLKRRKTHIAGVIIICSTIRPRALFIIEIFQPSVLMFYLFIYISLDPLLRPFFLFTFLRLRIFTHRHTRAGNNVARAAWRWRCAIPGIIEFLFSSYFSSSSSFFQSLRPILQREVSDVLIHSAGKQFDNRLAGHLRAVQI